MNYTHLLDAFALRLVFNLKPDDGAIRYQHMNTDNLPKTIKDTQE